jgi:hypothetical protein
VVAGLDHRGDVRVAVLPRDFGVEESMREAEHQPARTPVRQVEERVEVAFHQLLGAAAEIAVVVLIDEPGGGNLRAARQLPQFSTLLFGERLVEREELVVLILAHTYLAQCR